MKLMHIDVRAAQDFGKQVRLQGKLFSPLLNFKASLLGGFFVPSL